MSIYKEWNIYFLYIIRAILRYCILNAGEIRRSVSERQDYSNVMTLTSLLSNTELSKLFVAAKRKFYVQGGQS